MQKIKGWKFGTWSVIISKGKSSLNLYKQKMNTQNDLKVIEEVIWEKKELRNILRDVLFLEIDNADMID